LKQLKKKYNIPSDINRIILYAPTYREIISNKEPFKSEDLVELNIICIETKSIFLIKAHINEKIINFRDFKNIRLIRKDADIQELLLISDILISDYSSVICDYVLLDRPVLLYTYDYDEYISHRGIYYKKLEDIAPGPLLYTAEELFNAINNIDDIYKQYKSKAKKVKNYFNKYQDGNSSERLLRFLKLIN
jgi:CDP-glycerol glycerophosphotransferase